MRRLFFKKVVCGNKYTFNIWVFFRIFRVVSVFSVWFGLLRNRSVCFGCFDIGSKHRNKPKFIVFGFMKQTETNAKQILFRFVSVRTENYFCLFRGHPSLTYECSSDRDDVRGDTMVLLYAHALQFYRVMITVNTELSTTDFWGGGEAWAPVSQWYQFTGKWYITFSRSPHPPGS